MSLEPAPISRAHRQIATVALFVASGYPPAARWRWQLRRVAILLFLIALGAAPVEVAIWLLGAKP